MIDTHIHILPGIDDGAKNLSTSLDMARMAAADGIHRIVATPHVMNGSFDNSKDSILQLTREFTLKLQDENIDLQVLPGGEYYFDPDLAERGARGELLTLNDTGRYILVEFAAAFLPDYTEEILYELQLQGMTPVIAHPERNLVLSANPRILAAFIERGMLAQVTAGSITGLFGKEGQKNAQKLLNAGLIHLVVSDAHSTRGRSPLLSPAYKILSQWYDDEYARQLLFENPARVVAGQDLAEQLPPPTGGWARQLKKCLGLW